MNALQAHRGPDGEGVFEDPQLCVALGHVRLAVLDLSPAAAQPMQSADGRFVLSYNGEIYNFREIRQRLKSLGYGFRSQGDTEVLLTALRHWGPAAVEKLNGIFAFACWDNQQCELLLARDRMGVKPLYYAVPKPGTLLFASEIKALLAHPDIHREPDFRVLHQHLAFGHACGEETAIAGVKRLLPGTILRWQGTSQTYSLHSYWQTDFSPTAGDSYDDTVHQLREVMRRATAEQMVSDVPVGAFLSGGLDSSLITAMAGNGPQHLDCFTTTCSATDNRVDQSANDLPYARQMADVLQVDLHEISLDASATSLIPRLAFHLDEPLVDPAVIACYLICSLAKQNGVTVLLSGQGADELFAGYPRYRAMESTRWLHRLPNWSRHGIGAAANRIPASFPGRVGASARRLRRVLAAASSDSQQRFLQYCTSTPEAEIRSVLNTEVLNKIGEQPATNSCSVRMRQRALPGIQSFLERDQGVYLPNHNLLYTDKMSMACGIEARVPFLDNGVVRFVNGIPDRWKLKGRTTKAILRDAAHGIVPPSIVHRSKAGFGAPYRSWLRKDMVELWREVTSPTALRSRGWFDADALEAARRRCLTGQADLYMLQWAVLSIELWAREFIDIPVETRLAELAIGNHTRAHSAA